MTSISMERSSISTIVWEMLDMVPERMAHFNVRLKPNKCFFGMRSVEFLGHIFDEHGVHLSDKRVQAIQDIPIEIGFSSMQRR